MARIRLRFNEAKTAQTAARLLKNCGGSLNYMKLLKLLYLVDREALEQWGRPVTTDRYVSMDKGPVLSRTFDLITYGAAPGETSTWNTLISPARGYSVSLLTENPPDEELSRAEEELIDGVCQRFGAMDQWSLVDYVHTLPEWHDPEGTSTPIEYSDILRALGKSEDEISEIEGELMGLRAAERLAPA